MTRRALKPQPKRNRQPGRGPPSILYEPSKIRHVLSSFRRSVPAHHCGAGPGNQNLLEDTCYIPTILDSALIDSCSHHRAVTAEKSVVDHLKLCKRLVTRAGAGQRE